MTLETLKANTIKLVNGYYGSNIIEPEYPLYRQLNIIRAGGGPLATMTAFIDGKRSDNDSIEVAINALAVSDLWDNFTDTTDAEIALYVATALPVLTTTEMRMAVATSVRRAKKYL